MGGPKENPNDVKARNLERRTSLLERRRASEKNADGLTTDFRSVFGLNGLSLIGQQGQAAATVKAPPAKTNVSGILARGR